jgi:hypothetical protein
MSYTQWLHNIHELLVFYVSNESNNYLVSEFLSQIFDDNNLVAFINCDLTVKLFNSTNLKLLTELKDYFNKVDENILQLKSIKNDRSIEIINRINKYLDV